MISLILVFLFLKIAEGQNKIIGKPQNTNLTMNVSVHIGRKKFEFAPSEIEESYVAKNIFKPGHFSIFDCLVHLYEKKEISTFQYHFDEDSQSYVIDVLNVEAGGNEDDTQYWWYHVHYDGGSKGEVSATRMSFYNVKDKMYIEFYQTNETEVQHKLDMFKREVDRTKKDGGQIIIPVVYFNRTKTKKISFTQVEIPSTNHGLREDLYYDNVITGADVYLTLGNDNKIQDEFLWYDNLWPDTHHDPNPMIKSYRVESIDGQTHTGACGWVFEFGEWVDVGWAGDMIHVQPDEHIMMFSPEYFQTYWIELGKC